MVFELIDEPVCLDFTGSFNAQVDGQGRLLLPAVFRNAMNGGDKKLKISFFTMAHPKDHKLVCFSREEFEKKLVPIPKEQRGAIIANAYRVDCQDNSGRFAVDILSRVSAWPENCREFVFVGAGDRFFICPAEEENAEAVAVIETFLEEPEA